MSDPFEILVRKRDAEKGYSPAGITMTQAEWDRRFLLRLLDEERATAVVKRRQIADWVMAIGSIDLSTGRRIRKADVLTIVYEEDK